MFLTERHYVPECALWHILSVQSESGWIISETSARELQAERETASLLVFRGEAQKSAKRTRKNSALTQTSRCLSNIGKSARGERSRKQKRVIQQSQKPPTKAAEMVADK